MRRLLLCLVAAIALSGCDLANQSFSCAPQIGSQRIDRDKYTIPSTTAGTGYAHC